MIAQKNTVDGIELYVFPAEYDCWNTINDKSPEQKMNYFTEDVGMNANYFIMFNEFPFWMNSKEYKLPTNIRGELYLFQHKQLLNRYSMERTTNGLGEVDYINLNQPITSGYYPMMHHYNGMPFPQRPANSKIPKEAFKDVQVINICFFIKYQMRINTERYKKICLKGYLKYKISLRDRCFDL